MHLLIYARVEDIDIMKIADAVKVGHFTLRNRIAMPPMATGKAVNGAPGDDMIEYYRQRSKDAGLIIVEHEYVSPEGMAHPTQLSIASDDVIPGYRKLAEAIHEQGAVAILQISHAGAMALNGGLPVLAPSAVKTREDREMPEEMTAEDIHRITACYAAAAVRAAEAGFDGVELHGAHGYLLNQFYSPITNKRTDAYSGSTMDGRIRFHLEALRAVREAIGQDALLAIRFGACDYAEGGSTIDEIPAAVQAFEAAGADLIDISGGVVHTTQKPGHEEPGWFADEGKAAKAAVQIPVLVTGGIHTGADAAKLLDEGAADIVCVSMALRKDAGWAAAALAGDR